MSLSQFVKPVVVAVATMFALSVVTPTDADAAGSARVMMKRDTHCC
jgi:hypothetical protein